MIDIFYHISECDSPHHGGSRSSFAAQRKKGWEKTMMFPFEIKPYPPKKFFTMLAMIFFVAVLCTCCNEEVTGNPFEIGSPLFYVSLVVGIFVAAIIMFEIVKKWRSQ